ncbi:hypothetical protein FRC11_003150, partial [Ceratobasidium sp. 423]
MASLFKHNQLDSDSRRFLDTVKARGKKYSLGFILDSDRNIQLLLDQAVKVFNSTKTIFARDRSGAHYGTPILPEPPERHTSIKKSCQANRPKLLPAISTSYAATVPVDYMTTRPGLPPLAVVQLPNGDNRVLAEFCPGGPKEALFSPTQREVIVSQFPDSSRLSIPYDEIINKAKVELWPSTDADNLDRLVEKSLNIMSRSSDPDILRWSGEATERMATLVTICEPLLVGQAKKPGTAITLWRYVCERIIPHITDSVHYCPECPFETDTAKGWWQHMNAQHGGTDAKPMILGMDDVTRFTRDRYSHTVYAGPIHSSSSGAGSSHKSVGSSRKSVGSSTSGGSSSTGGAGSSTGVGPIRSGNDQKSSRQKARKQAPI